MSLTQLHARISIFFLKLLTSSGFLSHVTQQLPADENRLKMGKTTAANPRRAALGEITNVNAAAANVKVINHQRRFYAVKP